MISSVFIGTSLDGFIARANDSFDFLPAGGGEPHGYAEFIADTDAIVMGRRTYDVVLKFAEWPFKDKPVFVLSSSELSPPLPGARVDHVSGAPGEVVDALSVRGFRRLYIDGGQTIQAFLRANQIHRLVITRVPVLIGSGVPLFGVVDADIALRHVATRTFKSGLVQSEYHVVGARDPGSSIAPLW